MGLVHVPIVTPSPPNSPPPPSHSPARAPSPRPPPPTPHPPTSRAVCPTPSAGSSRSRASRGPSTSRSIATPISTRSDRRRWTGRWSGRRWSTTDRRGTRRRYAIPERPAACRRVLKLRPQRCPISPLCAGGDGRRRAGWRLMCGRWDRKEIVGMVGSQVAWCARARARVCVCVFERERGRKTARTERDVCAVKRRGQVSRSTRAHSYELLRAPTLLHCRYSCTPGPAPTRQRHPPGRHSRSATTPCRHVYS